MILDTSAIIAILRGEPEAAEFEKAIERATVRRVSAATYVEAGCVIDSARDPLVSRRLDDLLREAECTVEPVTDRQAQLARQAYRDYGRGSGHPAQLNFGDCFAYALAKDLGDSLLFKDTDFGATDVRRAL